MDARRFLIVATSGLLGSCAHLGGDAPRAEAAVPLQAMQALDEPDAAAGSAVVTGSQDTKTDPAETARPEPVAGAGVSSVAPVATLSHHEDRMDGRIQVFAWAPGRVFEVRTAPLRVTTLTLSPGETVTAKAAGDTVRWQIGETTSGSGVQARTHVMFKPLERGLSTNLVLTTDRRVYLIDLKSGPVERFNPAVAWQVDDESIVEAPADASQPEATAAAPRGLPAALSSTTYRIEGGRRIPWTPVAVFDDGRRTFIVLPSDRRATETPVLLVHGDGGLQTVNYRQDGDILIADRLFDRAELRLGDRRSRTVSITRSTGARR